MNKYPVRAKQDKFSHLINLLSFCEVEIFIFRKLASKSFYWSFISNKTTALNPTKNQTTGNYFLIRKLKQKNLIYLLLTRGKKSKWILIGIVYWASSSRLSSFYWASSSRLSSFYWASSSRLSSFVHHVVRDKKLHAQKKNVCANDIQQVYRVM